MDLYLNLKDNQMFSNIKEESLKNLFQNPSFFIKSYNKGECVIYYHEDVQCLGFILKGSASIGEVDVWGNKHILRKLQVGELFGESFYFSKIEKYPIELYANEDSEILFFHYNQVIKTCSDEVKSQLMENMLLILSQKNIHLTQKIQIIRQHKIRDKILSYLSNESLKAKSNIFNIPFDRNELAEYLSCDRSALSKELGRMEKEGLLKYHKNHFELIEILKV